VKLHKAAFEADRNTGDAETSKYIASRNLYRPKFFPLHTMKAYRGSGFIDPLILTLGTGGTECFNFTPGRITPGK
jgi:hypothetical protein